MSGIRIQRGRILYYGNPAGYVEGGRAIVDPLFQRDELLRYLTEQKLETRWVNGVYERLFSCAANDGEAPTLLSCRIYQLRQEADIRMKFISLAEMRKRFGEPNPKQYRLVYDGQTATRDLEAIYETFQRQPPEKEGRFLAMSDVIELYSETERACYYVDQFGFQRIPFHSASLRLETDSN